MILFLFSFSQLKNISKSKNPFFLNGFRNAHETTDVWDSYHAGTIFKVSHNSNLITLTETKLEFIYKFCNKVLFNKVSGDSWVYIDRT